MPSKKREGEGSNILAIFLFERDDRKMRAHREPLDAGEQADIVVEDEFDDDHRPRGVLG